MALTSLLLAGVLLVYWWRSNHGHSDSFMLGKDSPTQSHFFTVNGRIAMEGSEAVGDQIVNKLQFYEFKNVLAYCLIIPGLWLAIKIRSLLPRPPGMRRNAE